MEIISQLPKYITTAMLSLDNDNFKATSQVNLNTTMTPTSDLDFNEVLSMMNKVAAPADYNELVSSQSVIALENLGETYQAAAIPLAQKSEENLDTDVEMDGDSASVDTDVLLVSAEETIAKQTALVKETENTLDQVRYSVKNDALMAKMTTSEVQGLNQEYQQVAKKIESKATIDTGTSYAELWKRIADATATIKTDYVDFYSTLMQKYTEMYEAFNTYCQKASSSAVSTGDDGNNVKFNTGTMNSGYNNFYNKLVSIENSLGSIKNWGQMSSEERESMVATLEPAFKVDNGKIWFNIDQYNSVKGTQPSGISDGKVSTASYQAWLATFNAAGSAFQSNMQSFAQRYSQANSTFDNLNKVLSGAISSLAESAKEVLKSLG